MNRIGIFFDTIDDTETGIFSLYQQNNNKLLHSGQILSNVQEEILHEIIFETKILLKKSKDKQVKIDIYGSSDGHENAVKFIKYIREYFPDLDLLGYKQI